MSTKNPVKAAFKLVWGKTVTVAACDSNDEPFQLRFKYLEIVGNGTFGIVCRAQNMDTQEIIAIKTVFQDEGHQNRELGIIKALRNPNIVSLKGYFYTRNESNEEFLSLILEYVPMSLDRILKDHEKRKEPVSLVLVQLCMFQFMKALEYLHGRGICHRDIKPHNLLADPSTGVVKLCDFGCSKRLVDGEPNIQYICARYYRAPEIVFGWPHYSCAIDLWSAGCVMMELLTGKPAFPGKNSIDQLARIVKVLGSPTSEDLAAMGQGSRKFKVNSASAGKAKDLGSLLPASCPLEAIDLIGSLLRYNPSQRITPSQALQHPFFSDLFSPLCKLPSGAPLNRIQLNLVGPHPSVQDNVSNGGNAPQPS